MVNLGTDEFVDLAELGTGGYGVVYSARQPAFDRIVAVKVLSFTDGRSLRRFSRERQALGKVSNHPHITPVFASGFTTDGRPYLAMELMRGGSLADRLETDGPMPWQTVLDLGVKLSGALETAHRAGILHRDLKPANILLSEYGEPRLADFGIASLDDGEQTKTGVITASVAYAAPEVLDGRRAGAESDVYGLAATLFTLVNGSAPFGVSGGESVLAMVLRVARDPVPDLRPRGVPDAFAAVLEKGMAKSPADRYSTAAALGTALRNAQQQLGIPQTPMVLPRSADISAAASTASPLDLTTDPDVAPGTVSTAGLAATPPPLAGATPAPPSGSAAPVWGRPPGDPPQAVTPDPVSRPSGPPTDEVSAAPQGGRAKWLLPAAALVLVAAVVGFAVTQLGGDGDVAVVAPTPTAAADQTEADPTEAVVATEAAPAVTDAVPTPTPAPSEGEDVAATIEPDTEEPMAPEADWVQARPVPVPRQQIPAVALRGRVWVAGGLDEAGVTTSVEGFEIASNSWRAGPDLPIPLHHHMTATFGSDLVILGGWSPQGALLSATVSDRVLALRGSQWVDLPPLPEPRVAGAAANVGGEIVVVGGQDVSGELALTTQIFDGQEWRQGAPMPTPREHLAAATDGRYLYAVGGRVLSADANLATIERYDPVADVWEAMPDMPTARGGLAATVVADRLLVAIGGERSLGVFDEVEAYDLVMGEWIEVPSLPTGRHGLGAAAVGGSLIAVGGALEPTHASPTDVVEVIGIE